MKGGKGKKRVYHSVEEFQKEVFPNAFKRKKHETPKDAHAVGVGLAKDSLDKIRSELEA